MAKELNAIEEITDEELSQIAGGAGCGWLCTITDDCPNSIFVCC